MQYVSSLSSSLIFSLFVSFQIAQAVPVPAPARSVTPAVCNPAVTIDRGTSVGFFSYTAITGRTIIYNDQTNVTGSYLKAYDIGADGAIGTADDRSGIIISQSANEWGATASGRYIAWQRNHLSHLEYFVYDLGPNLVAGDADDSGPFSLGSITNRNPAIYALPRINGDIVSWYDFIAKEVHWCTLAATPGVTSCFDPLKQNKFDTRSTASWWFVRDAMLYSDAMSPAPQFYFTGWNIAQWKAEIMSGAGLTAPVQLQFSDARITDLLYGVAVMSNSDMTELNVGLVNDRSGRLRAPLQPARNGIFVKEAVVSRSPSILGNFLAAWIRTTPNYSIDKSVIEFGPVLHPNGPQSLTVPNPNAVWQKYPSVNGNTVVWIEDDFARGFYSELRAVQCDFTR